MIRRIQNAKKARARVAARATTAVSPAVLRTPEELAQNSRLEQVVLNLRHDTRPPNTMKAIDSKQEEYMQYCDAVYPQDLYKYTLDTEKAYTFMHYQAFREQKPRGGNKSNLGRNSFFDLTDFTKVKGKSNIEVEPNKPVGKSVFMQYKAMLRKLYKEQTARRVISQHWEGIWTEAFEDLEKHVKERVPRKKKESYDEKAISEFTPYVVAERMDEIEDALWSAGYAPARRSVNCALRHRYCFLYLTSGLLRSKSLYRADLSDFMGLHIPKKDKDIHPMFLMVNVIPVGKTTHGTTQHGRATCHKDPKICCVGAVSFYLQYWFHNTRKFADFTVENWLDKKSWFDIKLLTDLVGDPTAVMNNDSYSGKLKSVLQQLGLPFCDLLHLGRKLGSKLLDMLEEEAREIKRMGQWADGVWDNAYSSKLPFGPIRKLAGYQSKDEFYFNTRTTVKPPESLLKATPMGEWIYDAYESVCAENFHTGKGQTAVQVLMFFVTIDEIFSQDAAAMVVTTPDRFTHPMFIQLRVFQMDEFKQHCQTMEQAIQHEANPMDADLERVLPGVFRWHQANQQGMSTLTGIVTSFISEFREGLNSMNACTATQRAEAGKETDRRLASTFISIAKHLSRSGKEANDPVTTSNEDSDLGEYESFMPATPPRTQEESSRSQVQQCNMITRHKTLNDL